MRSFCTAHNSEWHLLHSMGKAFLSAMIAPPVVQAFGLPAVAAGLLSLESFDPSHLTGI
jgi:hypothetical protein